MGWSAEYHDRQEIAKAAAAAKRPKRRAAPAPRPIDSGVWEVPAGVKTVAALVAVIATAAVVRRDNHKLRARRDRKNLLSKVGDAIGVRFQKLRGVLDWLNSARNRSSNDGADMARQRKHRKAKVRQPAQAAGEAAQRRAAELQPQAAAGPQPSHQQTAASGIPAATPDAAAAPATPPLPQMGKYLDAIDTPADSRPPQQQQQQQKRNTRGGKKKGKKKH